MMKLDPMFSAFIEIDSHALHTVSGGVHLVGEGGSISAAKPKKKGKGKKALGTGLLLLGHLHGPEHPDPGELDPGGSLVGKPQGRPPAAAPPFPHEPKPIPVPGGGVIIVPE